MKNIPEISDFPVAKHTAAAPIVPTKEENTGTFNSTNDNIEWAKWSWNPVTGCKHDCQYCYAYDIAMRFQGSFDPKFHENRLTMPANTKIPKGKETLPGIKNVFVCSMADLFGDWVPRIWIEKIINACIQNQQWTYLFLTKNPRRYAEFSFPANCWLGASADTQARLDNAVSAFSGIKERKNILFLSCEPLEENLAMPDGKFIDWLIIGGRSKSSRMPEHQPQIDWVNNLVNWAKTNDVKLYFKPNLESIPDKNFVPKDFPGMKNDTQITPTPIAPTPTQIAHNFQNIPSELKEKNNWVLWKLVEKKDKDGKIKPTKVPFQIAGKPAKSNDSTTWSSFQSVLEVYSKGGYNGIGYMFASDYIGIDIDHCVENGIIPNDVQYWIDTFASYTEYSQSGKGIHIIVKNTGIPGNATQKKPYEIYNNNRYFALTGNLVNPKFNTIQENDLAVKEFYIANIGNIEEKKETKSKKEYSKFSASNPGDLQNVVLEVLAQSNVCNDFDSWKRLALAFKSVDLPYSQVDSIFSNGAGYNQKQNEYLYSRMKPNQITFGTAYHIAKQANPTLLQEKLKELRAQNVVISTNIPADKTTKNSIFERDNKTYIVKVKKGKGSEGDEIFELEIACFTMDIEKKIIDDKGNVSYQTTLQNKGEKETIEIDGKTIGNIALFRDTIMSKGAFLYHVTDIPTHNQFIDFVLAKHTILKAKKTMHLGMIEEGFLTHSHLIKRDGSMIPIEQSKIIPPKPENAAKKMVISEKKIDIGEFLFHLGNIVGDQLWKCLGFIVATLFSDKIFEKFTGFPVLFFYGKHQTGKSTIAKVLQACLACSKAIGENSMGTQKAWKRIAMKFVNCTVILNEFQSNLANNTLICNLYDREGYLRGKKDNSFDTESMEINSSAVIVSTQNIVGAKAEDAQSRIIEIDSDKFAKNIDSFNWLKANMNDFSSILPQLLSAIDSQKILCEIETNINETRNLATSFGNEVEERIIINHAIVSTGYNMLIDKLSLGANLFVTQDQALAQICQQTQTTKDSDLGNTFLNHLVSIVRNDDIKNTIATIEKNDEKETLIFRLQDCLPIVRKLGKQADTGIADKTTIEKSLRLLGCELKTTRNLGAIPVKAWHYEIKTE